MKYILVQWSSGNIKSSILTENYVRDKSMLHDHTKEGIISFATVQQGDSPGDTSVVKNKGKLGRIACVSDDRKVVEEHQNLLLAGESEFIEDEVVYQPAPLKRPRTENINSSSPAKNVAIDPGLQEMILRMLSQALKKHLPDLLRNVLQSSMVITELRTCPTCKQSSESNPSTHTNTTTTSETTIVNGNTPMTEAIPTIALRQDELDTVENFKMITSPPHESAQSSTLPVARSTLTLPLVTSVASMANVPGDLGDDRNPLQPSLPQDDPEISLPGVSIDDNALQQVFAAHISTEQGTSLSVLDTPGSTIPNIDLKDAGYALTYRKMILKLMSQLFDKETLKVSTVTGGKKSGKFARQALDQNTVRYIIESVRKKFPDVSETKIREVMTQKCKDSRKKKKSSVSETKQKELKESTD